MTDQGDSFIAVPPAFRGDIKVAVDIMEEVARCYGFGRIPVTVPRTPLPEGILNRKERNIEKLRETVRKSGFTEVVNYSFHER